MGWSGWLDTLAEELWLADDRSQKALTAFHHHGDLLGCWLLTFFFFFFFFFFCAPSPPCMPQQHILLQRLQCIGRYREHKQSMPTQILALNNHLEIRRTTKIWARKQSLGQHQKELLVTIREEHPDIVVMGTHGRGVIGRLLMGSETPARAAQSGGSRLDGIPRGAHPGFQSNSAGVGFDATADT